MFSPVTFSLIPVYAYSAGFSHITVTLRLIETRRPSTLNLIRKLPFSLPRRSDKLSFPPFVYTNQPFSSSSLPFPENIPPHFDWTDSWTSPSECGKRFFFFLQLAFPPQPLFFFFFFFGRSDSIYDCFLIPSTFLVSCPPASFLSGHENHTPQNNSSPYPFPVHRESIYVPPLPPACIRAPSFRLSIS